MKLSIMALSLATLCIPNVVMAQSNAQTTPTPSPQSGTPPTADCTTPNCVTSRNQQGITNNGASTPGAQDSLGTRGTTSGSTGTSGGAAGPLPPTTPNSSGGANSNGDRGLSGTGTLNGGGSSSGGSSSGGSGGGL